MYRVDGVAIGLKDYGSRPFLVRNTVGRLAARREAKAYSAAAGLSGLPGFYGRLGPFSIALSWVAATPLAERERGSVGGAVFDRLERIVAGLHDRGIAVGDIHHRDVLVGDDGSVHLVDLATSVVLGARPGFLRRALFERLRDQDRVALARLRARFTGLDEDAAVEAVGSKAVARYARWRRVRRIWDAVRGRRRAPAGRK